MTGLSESYGQETIETTGAFLTYANPSEGIGTIQYPANWILDETYGNDMSRITFASPLENNSDQFPEGLKITVSVLPGKPNATITLDGYANLRNEALNETNTDFNIVEEDLGVTTLTSANFPTNSIVFTSTQQFGDSNGSQNATASFTLNLKTMSISMIVDDEVLYNLVYMAEEERYSNYLPTIQKMLDSFETTRSMSLVANTTNSTGTSPPSGCLIATAAFGSELTPQVQFLRDFRDNHILSTAAGSSFMNVFNAWYYSFSPQVADYERQQPWLQQTVKTAIHPLLGILGASEKAYSILPGNFGSLLAGMTASSLIGAVYFSPAALLLRRAGTKKLDFRLVVCSLAAVSLVFAVMTILMTDSTMLMASTSGFILATLSLGSIVTALMISKLVGKITINRLSKTR